MSDVTRILNRIGSDDPHATNELLPLVYEELRKLAAAKLAHEQPGQTLQATALVNEAYLRLVSKDALQSWESRSHFFAAAAEAMRRILVNRARDKRRLKRGGGRQKVDLTDLENALETQDDDLLALNDAIDQLAADDPIGADLVKLRFFAGLSLRQATELLGLAPRTADRHWAYARAWLYQHLAGDE